MIRQRLRKSKVNTVVTILIFAVVMIIQVFSPKETLGDGGDSQGSGYTMYLEEEGYPKEQTQVVVNILWDDKHNTTRPEYILLQLYKNDRSYNGPKKLSEENDWSYYWGGLSADAKWHIEEIETPKGYTKEIVEAIENVYTIVHKYDPDGKLANKAKTDAKDNEMLSKPTTSTEPIATIVPNFNEGPSAKTTIAMNDNNKGDISSDVTDIQELNVKNAKGGIFALLAMVMMGIKSVFILQGIFSKLKLR